MKFHYCPTKVNRFFALVRFTQNLYLITYFCRIMIINYILLPNKKQKISFNEKIIL